MLEHGSKLLQSNKTPQNAHKLFEFAKSLLHVWGIFFGCFDVWNYLEQVQNPQIMQQNANLITVWVGVMFLKHSIMHEKINFLINMYI